MLLPTSSCTRLQVRVSEVGARGSSSAPLKPAALMLHCWSRVNPIRPSCTIRLEQSASGQASAARPECQMKLRSGVGRDQGFVFTAAGRRIFAPLP